MVKNKTDNFIAYVIGLHEKSLILTSYYSLLCGSESTSDLDGI
jgi:hypothetical protein